MPQHLAIIMDGNGRWAEQHGKRRRDGHRAGQTALRETLKAAGEAGIKILTVFAFSSENWQRPRTEVGHLMELFVRALQDELDELDENQVRVKFIGDLDAFSAPLRALMRKAEKRTAQHSRLLLNIAASYGGRWDIVQAMQSLLQSQSDVPIKPEQLTEAQLASYLCLADSPPPDLLIRTGGEQRISNFMLWQMAYTELYFSPVLWPDFSAAELQSALNDYAGRQRRFGRVDGEVPC